MSFSEDRFMSMSAALAALDQEIAEQCRQAGRSPDSVTLVAVSKTHPPAAIREAALAGVRHIGENRVQELLAKRPALEDLPLHWHMIGHLQRNKVKAVLPMIDLLHTLDRLSLAEEIARRLPEGRELPVLIQVNTTDEESKSGIPPEEAPRFVDQVRALRGLRIRGFMTIGPLMGSEVEIRAAFRLLRRIRDDAAAGHPDLDMGILSMGMSGDFHLAIQEGATHLRVGTAIFGTR